MVVWQVVFGVLGGVIGGMGMGGGTLLIPLLTVFGEVNQHAAQAVNLISFVPMATVTILINVKNGLIEKKKLAYIIIPAVISCVGGTFLALSVSKEILKIFFGIFLIVLGGIFLISSIKNLKKKENIPKNQVFRLKLGKILLKNQILKFQKNIKKRLTNTGN